MESFVNESFNKYLAQNNLPKVEVNSDENKYTLSTMTWNSGILGNITFFGGLLALIIGAFSILRVIFTLFFGKKIVKQ